MLHNTVILVCLYVCACMHNQYYKLKALCFSPLFTQLHFAHKYHMCTKPARHLCEQFWCATKYCMYQSAAVIIQTASRMHLILENILILSQWLQIWHFSRLVECCGVYYNEICCCLLTVLKTVKKLQFQVMNDVINPEGLRVHIVCSTGSWPSSCCKFCSLLQIFN